MATGLMSMPLDAPPAPKRQSSDSILVCAVSSSVSYYCGQSPEDTLQDIERQIKIEKRIIQGAEKLVEVGYAYFVLLSFHGSLLRSSSQTATDTREEKSDRQAAPPEVWVPRTFACM